MTVSNPAPDSSRRYVLDSVRETDRDRFLGALFAPEPARRGLLALLAFDLELSRTASRHHCRRMRPSIGSRVTRRVRASS